MASNPGAQVIAVGDFNANAKPDFVWLDPGAGLKPLGMWELNLAQAAVTTFALAPAFDDAIYGSAHFSNNAGVPSQMLLNRGGAMTLQWVSSTGTYTGVQVAGGSWTGINYIAAGQFTAGAAQAGIADFLVSDAQNHLWDYSIGPGNILSKFDITALPGGQSWSGLTLLGTGQFFQAGVTNFLVLNNQSGSPQQNQAYDWWLDPLTNALRGTSATPAGDSWANKQLFAIGTFDTRSDLPAGRNEWLVRVTDPLSPLSNHLLEWYINGNGQTVGLDLGAAPGNVELVTIGHFDSNSAKSEMIVRNQSDGHLYEWWVTPNGTLSGVDLTANSGVGTGVQIIGTGNYFGSGDDDLLVHDTSNGNFYLWAPLVVQPGNPASTTIIGIALTDPPFSPDSTALLAQSMASFGSGSLQLTGSTTLSAVANLSHQTVLAPALNQHLA
jgi:hypothetical protein